MLSRGRRERFSSLPEPYYPAQASEASLRQSRRPISGSVFLRNREPSRNYCL